MINNNNLQAIKTLADKIEYTVTSTKKEARITPCYDNLAYDFYVEDMQAMLDEVKKDVIAIYHTNGRDFHHLFTNRNDRSNEYNNGLDMKRCKVTAKEANEVIEQYIDTLSDDYLYIEYEDDTTEKQKATIRKKILGNIIVASASAIGYSQGDCDKYMFVYYADASKEAKATIQMMIDNIKYLFTVQEYYVNLVTIETRKYTSGIEEVEEIEEDSESIISYSGDAKEEIKDLEARGYTVVIQD